jgi:ketosteroid isomerase-like protein
VWQMRDGKAVRFRQYSDTAMMRAVIEGARV